MTGGSAVEMKSPVEEDLFPMPRDGVGDVSDLLSLLRQKEKELDLAAQLGKALLSETQELKEHNHQLQERFSRTVEDLEQEKHEWRLRFEGKESEWEARVAELENDLQRLECELERRHRALQEADRDKIHSVQELREQNHRLLERLSKAAVMEQELTSELHSLRERHRDRSQLLIEDATTTHSLQAEVALLSEQKEELERRGAVLLRENVSLKSSSETRQEQLSLLQRVHQEQFLQLSLWQKEGEEMRELNRQLEVRLREVTEQLMMQEPTQANLSLLSEIELSLDTDSPSWGAERQQIKGEIVDLVQELQSLMGEDSPETGSHMEPQTLHAALSQLRHLVCSLSQSPATPVHVQGSRLVLRQESEQAAGRLEEQTGDQRLQQAVHERDAAIAKKNAVEAELAQCHLDLQLLNSQLLEAIQQKVGLSQELEAWQDDMHVVINQQLKTQQCSGRAAWAPGDNGSEGRDSKSLSHFLRRTKSQGFFSLFKM
uniref:Bicaudal D-related protein 1-like protein n=1 Tax=Callorhinchus milii TaxID=7868 RepID=V9KI59_CALMI